MATLAGIGSIVSKASAQQSFEFTNFRVGEIRGWRRAFNQNNWVNVAHGDGSPERGDTAALAMLPADPDYVSYVALMDVKEDGLKGFYEREAGYNIRWVPYQERAPDGSVSRAGEALLCTACADDAEADALWARGGKMEQHCPGSKYVVRWMSRSLRPLWPPPSAKLLPSPGYLHLCAAAHLHAGLLDHFLDSTLLNDRQTTLREHCAVDEATRRIIEAVRVE
uniref:Gamma-glutamylcyclotransferase n=1 Tax=Prymnesium polylepis TaxID=72548 RepID=A0A6V4WYN2_9EUKA|mmetsp:Transcript_25281/g.62665  ORF Transcript_25281/g.62665 Transcript_25281/m.62665 type:complete len:223 (+) Transcript_25281:66-734(+)